MIERMNGEQITFSTRREAYDTIDKQRRYAQILKILNHPMTAKEIAVEMYKRGYTDNDDRNNAAPRLTEMAQQGTVDTIGKTRCSYTGKTVTVYQRRA